MRRIIILAVITAASLSLAAQVPYFAGTVGDKKLYGYTSIKFRPGINAQESYTTFQYGIGSYFATGLDLYTGNGDVYSGFLVRAGKKFNDRIGVGVQITPSFCLSNNFKFGYLTAALYLNGSITRDNKLFWCSNTWWGINNGSPNTITNWEYIGYSFSLKNGHGITPMIGAIHSWKFDQDIDLAAGLYYSIPKWNFYVWGNDFLKKHPRIVFGIDFTL